MKHILFVLALLMSQVSYAESQTQQHINVVTATGDYQITEADHVVIIKKASDEYTIVMLPASPDAGDEYIVKDGLCAADEYGMILGLEVSSPDNNYANQIDKADRFVMVNPCAAVTVLFDGTEWHTTSQAFY